MSEAITASTRLLGVAGYQIGYTLSPIMHNAAFKAQNLDYVYVCFDFPPAAVKEAIRGIRALNMVGLNVTKPHKAAVMPLLDKVTESAKAIESVNTIVNQDGYLTGYSTDGVGLLRALAELDMKPLDKRVVLLGAGGAGRAIAVALQAVGVRDLVIINRTLAKAATIADQVAATALGLEDDATVETLSQADLIINAVSSDLSLPGVSFRIGQLVYDTRYDAAETRLMQRARAQGARVANGLSMLLHQGAASFSLWTGLEPSLPAMRQALQTAWRKRLSHA